MGYSALLGHGTESFQDQCKRFEAAMHARERAAQAQADVRTKEQAASTMMQQQRGLESSRRYLAGSPFALCHNKEQTPGTVSPAAARQMQSEKWHGFRFE